MATEAQYRYIARCQALVDQHAALLSVEELRDARELIAHNEAAEGVRILAFALEEHGTEVPPALKATIVELVRGFIPREHMPVGFRGLMT